jgi:hypothetical protein
MTSEAQRTANRRNAQRSTGPRSAAGKGRSRLNALQHGLNARLGQDPERDQRVESLARLIAGAGANASQLHFARIAADATLQIARIRVLRTTLMEPAAREREVFSWSLPKRVCWQRHYRKDRIDFDAVATMAEQDPGDGSSFSERFFALAAPMKRVPPRPSGPEASIEILSRFIGQVHKLDRYEQRELSRRKTAFRALESLRLSRAQEESSRRSSEESRGDLHL